MIHFALALWPLWLILAAVAAILIFNPKESL